MEQFLEKFMQPFENIFRGKRADTGEWVEGNLVNVVSLNTESNKGWRILTQLRDGLVYHPISYETVGQYIWLDYINQGQKKMFVGDIFSTGTTAKYLVKQVKGGFIGECYLSGRRPNSPYHYDIDLTKATMDDVKYEGNLYDNPELLKR